MPKNKQITDADLDKDVLQQGEYDEPEETVAVSQDDDNPTPVVEGGVDEDAASSLFGTPPPPFDMTPASDEDFVPPQYDAPPGAFGGSGGQSDKKVEIDFDFLDDDEALIPAGVYPARVAECRQTVSQNSGNPLLIMDFLLLPHPDVPEAFRGKEYPLFLAMIPSMGWKIKKVGKALNIPFKKGEKINPDEMRNVMVLVEIELREYNGEMRASVKDVFGYPDNLGVKWQPGMTFGNVPMF